MVEFAASGATCGGYIATPAAPGPAVIVIQEWWGLVDHIRDVCDRFAAEGFVALAPDLYHGRTAKPTEPDLAGKLLMGLKLEKAGKDMADAHDYLLALDVVSPKKVGVIGFCAGGNLAYQLAALRPVACAAFYPYPFLPWPDPAAIKGPAQFHIAALDEAPTVETARQLVDELNDAGKQAELFVYEGADHAFFNDTRVDSYRPDAAKEAWERVGAFYGTTLR
jgi:carboxymethylenebutenolidase